MAVALFIVISLLITIAMNTVVNIMLVSTWRMHECRGTLASYIERRWLTSVVYVLLCLYVMWKLEIGLTGLLHLEDSLSVFLFSEVWTVLTGLLCGWSIGLIFADERLYKLWEGVFMRSIVMRVLHTHTPMRIAGVSPRFTKRRTLALRAQRQR